RPAGARSSTLRLAAPRHGAGDERVARERAAEDPAHAARAREQRVEVDARRDAHLAEHRDEVLGRDVAGRAGGHGAAAELAEGGLEAVDARLERGEHVRERLPARVVEVRGELERGRKALARGGEELAYRARARHAGRVPEADLLRAGCVQARGDVEHALDGDVALVGAAEGGRDHALAAQ